MTEENDKILADIFAGLLKVVLIRLGIYLFPQIFYSDFVMSQLYETKIP